MDQQRLIALKKMPYEEYLETPEWLAKRQLVLDRDEGCRLCNTQEKLEVHHRTYIRRGNEDLNDLTTLCESCHEHFHRKRSQADIMGRTYSPPREGEPKKLQWEDYLIGLLLRNPELSSYVCGIINIGDFAGTDTRELYHILNSMYQQRASSPSLQPVEQFVPSELLGTVARATKCVESSSPKDGAGLVKEAIQCATRLKQISLLRINAELTHKIDAADKAGDKETVQQLSKQLSTTQRELRTIYSATHLQG